jgi:hypothetical protein
MKYETDLKPQSPEPQFSWWGQLYDVLLEQVRRDIDDLRNSSNEPSALTKYF